MKRFFRPLIEQLEDRRLLATVTVNDGLWEMGVDDVTGNLTVWKLTAGGADHLQEGSLRIRTSTSGTTSGAASLLKDAVAPLAVTPFGNRIDVEYGSPVVVSVSYTLMGISDTQSDIFETIRITNFSSDPLNVGLFEYTDLDLGGSGVEADNDRAQLFAKTPNAQIKQSGSALPNAPEVGATVLGSLQPTRFQIDNSTTLSSQLASSTPDLLNSIASSTPPFPEPPIAGNVTHAYQWEFTVAPEGFTEVQSTKHFDQPSLPPVVTLDPGPLPPGQDNPRFTVGGSPLFVAPGSSTNVSDADSANFHGGVLGVEITPDLPAGAPPLPFDEISINSQGTAAGQISVSGSTISFGGMPIATFGGGINTLPLFINLNTGADAGAVKALLQNITYRYVPMPPALPKPTYRLLRFTLTDGDGGTSEAKTQRVDLVNRAPTLNAAGPFSIPEHPQGSPPPFPPFVNVGAPLVASDLDSDPVILEITAGNDGNAFMIDPMGQLTAEAASLDREAKSSYSLTIRAVDQQMVPAANLASDPITVVVNITDVNEFAPVFTASGPFTVETNSPNSTVVGKVTATDDDTGQTVTFSITDGNNDGAFAISSAGQITVANSANVTTRPLTVRATDNGSPAKTTDASVTINVGPKVLNHSGVLAEGATITLSGSHLSATDADSDDAALIFTLTTAPSRGTLNKNSTALGAGDTFTQADITADKISYTHNGSNTTSDDFQFTVKDPGQQRNAGDHVQPDDHGG